MLLFNSKEQLFLLLAQKTTVLTPNNRLSDSILQQYFIHCQNQTITKPKCIPYRVALIKAYEQLHGTHPESTHPTLLNEAQCHYLWRKLIQSTPNITYSSGLLQSVMSAWERCLQWQIPVDDPAFNYTDQTRQFQKWWQLLEYQLKENHFITEHQLTDYLIAANTSLFSQAVVWVCFDEFTPIQLQLQDHLGQQGFLQYHYDLEEKLTTTKVFSAQDKPDEYQQLISWLHLKLHEGNQRIGVVIPNLEQESHTVHRILSHHFESSLFNSSLGHPLSNFPLVNHALCWLHLDGHYIDPHQASLLLHSPYLGGAKEELLLRSEYLQISTLLEKHIIPFTSFIDELIEHAPKLGKLLNNLSQYPPEATLHEWITLFQERLNTLGFPGEYGLNSENYQSLNRFILLFDELRQFSLLNTNITKSDVLDLMHYLADNTIFQAQKINAPIQVSGLLEASGCEFDSIWVMGLTDHCLPQKVHLSAFIPPQLQRDLKMPHSLPERELQFAQQILSRLQRSAPAVVFSYAQLHGDTPNLPCALINHFEPFERLPLPESQNQDHLIYLEEDFSIPLRTEERIFGGTALLTNQAKCPFKAFAQHRLHARGASLTTEGLDHKERGQIIHKVMELLWQKLGDQQKLLGILPDILEQSIDEAIHSALAPLTQQDPALFSNAVQEIEYVRLKRLVHSYLEWEKKRHPFTTIALEQSYTINLAGLDFQVRIDRLDQVGNKKWVIDYKSTLPSSKPWNEDRPTESQLLLYALLDEHINTLMFLQLKTGKISCAGFSEEDTRIAGITTLKKEEQWASYRTTWQHQLTDLATEFKQGHCPPQPANLTICQQCEMQNLCRFEGG